MTDAEVVNGFAALAEPARLAILRHLVRAGPAGLSAGAVAAAVGASPSRASFHLGVLRDAGLVASRREGRGVIYAVRMAGIGRLVGWLVEDCCVGDATLRDCCR